MVCSAFGAGAENASEPGRGIREKLNSLPRQLYPRHVDGATYFWYWTIHNGPDLVESGATSPLTFQLSCNTMVKVSDLTSEVRVDTRQIAERALQPSSPAKA